MPSKAACSTFPATILISFAPANRKKVSVSPECIILSAIVKSPEIVRALKVPRLVIFVCAAVASVPVIFPVAVIVLEKVAAPVTSNPPLEVTCKAPVAFIS